MESDSGYNGGASGSVERALLAIGSCPETYEYLLKLNGATNSAAFKETLKQVYSEPMGIMQISPIEGQFLRVLVTAIRATRVLEVGVFKGTSAVYLVDSICKHDAGGNDTAALQYVGLDMSEEWTNRAREKWKSLGLPSSQMEIRLGDAKKTLKTMVAQNSTTPFDICFIDAQKSQYEDYFECCLALTRKGGLIVLDNMLMHGNSAKAPDEGDTEGVKVIRNLNEKLSKDERVCSALVPIDDGVSVCVKL